MKRSEYLKRFQEIVNSDMELTERKNSDYTGDRGALDNFMVVENAGLMSAELGIFVRLSDKFSRMSSLMKPGHKQQVMDEKLADTIQDMRVYLTILQILLERKQHQANSISELARIAQEDDDINGY
jgi:hypothetical protein